MSIRLWPQEYERKDHITKAEKAILRYAARNFQDGHIVVGIDPVGLSSEKVKLGMYISLTEGLITFSIYTGKINAAPVFVYRTYVEMVEKKIYERLLDSKMLIVRNGANKALKFPYKHVVMFPDEIVSAPSVSREELKQMHNYAVFDAFRPITSVGRERRIEDLKIFEGIRLPYDKSFTKITDVECRAIFERLAPEYTVVQNEREIVRVAEKKTFVTDADHRITGHELAYKTFELDEYQVGVVNDMGTGHRVILANPGAGKSVLLLSKAFKYASLYKESMVLLTCYNNNLADAYNFKRSCANFGDNNNLFIMTFHKLVKKIYEECLHSHCESNIATDEEIQACIDLAKQGKLNLRFKAIFIDEVQIFDPLYLELCYYLLEDDEDRVFLMAGDLNQAVRALSRKGDAPWKRMNGIGLDFKGRVRYIEKNYRNSKEIGEYISNMLQHMNKRLTMLDLINSLEYEYNSFKVGDNPTIALKVQTGIPRIDIRNYVISAIKEIAETYKISYSDIAVLFPFRQVPYMKYHFLYWLQQGLDDAGITYSMIINEKDNQFAKTRQGDITGVIISTIESSLGLDFKAVILAGLYPYSYVNKDGEVGKEIKSWSDIKNMPSDDQTAVQSQMRAVYTACSRARDVLYVLSDMKSDSPMEEIIRNSSRNIIVGAGAGNTKRTFAVEAGVTSKAPPENLLDEVVDKVTVKVYIQELGKNTTVIIDLEKYPKQKDIIGKKVGETFKFPGVKFTYEIVKIISNESPNQAKTAAPHAIVQASPANLKEYFTRAGFTVKDLRSSNGCLWVIGERKALEPYVETVSKALGVTGGYSTSKATGWKPGWWTKSRM